MDFSCEPNIKVSWSKSEFKVRLVTLNMFKPSPNFYWLLQGGVSFVDPFCYLCFTFVFIMLFYLFFVALWLPVGKGLAFWLSSVWCFLVFLSLSHMVYWVLDCIDSWSLPSSLLRKQCRPWWNIALGCTLSWFPLFDKIHVLGFWSSIVKVSKQEVFKKIFISYHMNAT